MLTSREEGRTVEEFSLGSRAWLHPIYVVTLARPQFPFGEVDPGSTPATF